MNNSFLHNNLFETAADANLKVIISGGGTGGHIFPAIAIANALRAVRPNIDILFVGAENRMEMEKVPAAGYAIEGLPVAGFHRKALHKNVAVVMKLFRSLLKARRIVKKFKPAFVVGVGGYASGPTLRAAAAAGIPIFIQEQNSYAGLTNKLLAKKANKIFVAYRGMDKYFPASRIVLAGNPVRQGLHDLASKKDEALQFFGLAADKPVVLCIGGSLGAGTINQSMVHGLKNIENSGVQFIWQCGGYYYQQMSTLLAESKVANVKLFDFIARMDMAYAAADVVISRAGASSISELCIVAKPCILVPSPNVAEDHQTKNAQALVNENAAILITDENANKYLINKSLDLVLDTKSCNELSHNIAKMALHNAAENIANEILETFNINNRT